MEDFEELANLSREDYGSYLFVAGAEEDDLLRHYGVDRSMLVESRIVDLSWGEDGGPRTVVSVMPSVNGWAAVGEHGVDSIGWRIVREVSVGTNAVLLNYSWARPRLIVAVDGVVSRSVEPTSPAYDPDEAIPEEGGLAFGGPAGYATVFSFIERLTGHHMTPAWMLGPFLAATV